MPYLLDRWTDEQLNERTSVQVHLLSGDKPNQKLRHRISSDQDEWVIELLINDSMLSPEGSFNAHVMNDDKIRSDLTGGLFQMLSRLLFGHAKTIARRWVVMAMKGRDKACNEVWLQMRVPLGLKVRHTPVTKAEDDIFYGIKYVVNKGDGAVMLHAEFIGLKKDGYSPMKDEPSVRSAAVEFAYASKGGVIPEYVSLRDSDDDDDSWEEWKTTNI